MMMMMKRAYTTVLKYSRSLTRIKLYIWIWSIWLVNLSEEKTDVPDGKNCPLTLFCVAAQTV